MEIIRGAWRAPRGLRAHQKPLRTRDNIRTRTRHRIWPRCPNTRAEATKKARKGGSATQANQGTRQANQIGGRQAKRAKKQASRRPKKLTNILSSNKQGAHQNPLQIRDRYRTLTQLPRPEHIKKPRPPNQRDQSLSSPLQIQERPIRRTTKPPPLRERELKKPDPEPEPRKPEVRKAVATTKAQETSQGEDKKWEVVNPETDKVGRYMSYLYVRGCILARVEAPSIGPWQRKKVERTKGKIYPTIPYLKGCRRIQRHANGIEPRKQKERRNQAKKSVSKQGQKGEKAGGKMLADYAPQRVVSTSRRPRGSVPTSFSNGIQRVLDKPEYCEETRRRKTFFILFHFSKSFYHRTRMCATSIGGLHASQVVA